MKAIRFSLIFYKDFPRFLRAAHPIQYAQRTQIIARSVPNYLKENGHR